MKRTICNIMFILLVSFGVTGLRGQVSNGPASGVPLHSIRLSDPCILADAATGMYYMTGTGGRMWKSKDLRLWDGPYDVIEIDPASWMGTRPMVWAAELHAYNGKYYYFATFTNRAVTIDTVAGTPIERRASHVLVSDKPDGPYRPMKDETYLPADQPTLDGTFWVDSDGKPYMIFCHEWLQNLNGTMEKIELKPDLSGSVGGRKLLFRASDSPWSRERDRNGNDRPNKVTDGPWLFKTGTGRLGMIWTSWIYDVYTQGVAWSESGTLDGPWVHEPEPITPPNFGHGMLFRTFEGKLLMAVHSHRNEGGRYIRIPNLFEVDTTGDRLVVGERYVPATERKRADAPLFIDPVYNGSADPVVCFNRQSGKWWMYYTSRRVNRTDLGGIERIHGSPIGIAESSDGGATWNYIGDCNIDYKPDPEPTYWAPEIFWHEGLYHMYLSYVPGVFDTWEHPRDIVHLTSEDGKDWKTRSVLDLASRKVIDAGVIRLPDGVWRMWYKNEGRDNEIWYADSDDLYNWIDRGEVDLNGLHGEGANVIFWHDKYYMFVDEWKGLSVFSSDDATNWVKQQEYLIAGIPADGSSGEGSGRPQYIEGTRGNHADIEVVGDHAYMFYFSGVTMKNGNSGLGVFVQELIHNEDGTISCDPTAPCYIDLNAGMR